ncbi:hypothetical protein RND71_008518 [Anisodus tanguticus]|uniref:Uncharacterized protein n=1 Tax=Anisodus tanguticus TaxID=243964 RepID=A0AAE1VTV1_9SOLA|nr:hypothetical protein RND71_008518 [Anisodus tanguticus]
MKQYHDKKILKWEFQPKDDVLLFNSRLKLFPEKLKSKWSIPSGSVSPNGSMELKFVDRTRTFRVNVHKVKHYHGCIDGDTIADRHRMKH